MWHDSSMDDTTLDSTSKTATGKFVHWHAHLQLTFANEQARTYLAKKRHIGPLVLQKTLHPEGEEVCHGVIVHPPGGVAGGDALKLTVQLDAQANVLLTTPGAGKWYKANGLNASQHLEVELANYACLEWLPQENILFNGAAVQLSAEVHLAEHAHFASWEITCFGRQAQGEHWHHGHYQQGIRIYRQGRLIWQERAHHTADSVLMQSRVGLAGHAVNATFIVVAGKVPDDLLNTCRSMEFNKDMDPLARVGMTALPEVFCARYVGQSSQTAKHYFEALWGCLRPWYLQKSATRPRIWNT